jgi:ribosomal protein L11
MKILHIIPSYVPAGFAAGTIGPTHSLNKALVKQGIDVTVFTTNIDGATTTDVSLDKEVDVDGVKVFYFPITFRPWQYASDM